MTVLQALLLGIVQGLTEFLPVSSSGHLVLLQNLFNIDLADTDMFYDIILHIGTLFAVCAVLRKDIIKLFRKPFKNLLYLVLASIPAAVVGVIFGDWVNATFFGGTYLFIGFLISAVLLAAAQIYAKRKNPSLPLCKKSAAAMGIAQAVAILPGISRSGATVAAGTLAGADRVQAANFSFLMSIPVIAGSFVITLIKGIVGGELAATFVNAGSGFGVCVAVGIAAAAVSGFAAIKVMLKAATKAGYTPFIIYLVLLAVLCAYLTFSGRL
ncbi:MAG: undecaprenyl-diphosphate phosphatase [Clostridia bacterium]|nr:undecaprenyl-diphosphate phosphatase [Clostridia bacterium]